MNIITQALAPAAILLLIPSVAYCGLYLFLRFAGKLRVAPGGWHAEGVCFGGRVYCAAVDLFALYQQPLRLEAAGWRLLRRRRTGEPVVSDVVVELVPMT